MSLPAVVGMAVVGDANWKVCTESVEPAPGSTDSAASGDRSQSIVHRRPVALRLFRPSRLQGRIAERRQFPPSGCRTLARSLSTMDNFSAEGRWWLPGHVEDAVPGSFSFQGGDAALTVYGSLSRPDDAQGPSRGLRQVAYRVVHGHTNTGEDITLFSAHGVESSWRGTDSKTTFLVEGGVSGRHLDADAFGAIAFELDYLPPWLNPPSLLNQEDFNALAVDLKTHILVEVPLDGADFEIRTTMHGQWRPHVDLHQSTTIWVELAQALSYTDALQRYVRPVEDLLALCLDRSVSLSRFLGSAPGDGDRGPAVPIFFRNAGIEPTREPSLSDIVGMGSNTLLWMGDSPMSASELLKRWFSQYEELRPALVPLLGRHYASFMYAEHELISTVSAAEALHKQLDAFESKQVSKAEHTKRKEAVLSAATAAEVDAGVLDWASRVLASANRKPLKEVVAELLAATGNVGRAILDGESDFCANIISLRVPVAHGNAGSRKELSHAQRHRHDQALRWVVRCLLVGELLDDHAEAQRRVLSKESFKFAVRRLADPEGTD